MGQPRWTSWTLDVVDPGRPERTRAGPRRSGGADRGSARSRGDRRGPTRTATAAGDQGIGGPRPASGLPTSTLTRYLQALQALFLVEEVPAWALSAGKRLARRPKLMISDTGLGGALLGMTAARWTGVDEARGPLTETFAALELRRQLGWSAVSATPHHYRDHDGAEVDLLTEADDGRLVGIEVESGPRLGLGATRHLAGLRLAVGERFARGVVLHGGGTAAPLDDRTWALPISALWTTS